MKERTFINSNKIIRVIAVGIICALDIVPASMFIYFLKSQNLLISVKNASGNLLSIIGQNLITVSFSIILLVAMVFIQKENFVKELYLGVKDKKQAITVTLLVSILSIMTTVLLIIKEDKITVIYSLFYYVFFIAFFEEFVCRGVCVYILKDFAKTYKYIIPNLLFAFMHIFSYSNWSSLSIEYIINFVSSSVFGLFLVGCFFQLIKEKSGTLWVPILLHAIMDYSGVF